MSIGYEMFRRLAQGEGIRYKPWKQSQEAALLDPGLFTNLWPFFADHVTLIGPDIIVCDEGHRLKNSESTISSVMNRVKTRRRLVLTGTPLQNNLAECRSLIGWNRSRHSPITWLFTDHCMVSYVKPNLLGSLKEFRNRFVNPISNGQHLDSTMQDVALMKKRSHVLFELLRGFVQVFATYFDPHLLIRVFRGKITPLLQSIFVKNTNTSSKSVWVRSSSSCTQNISKM